MLSVPAVLSSSSLEGNSVKNHEDEDLGDIKDFMIDTDSGKVAYAVLSFGGVLGIGNKLFAIPMSALKLDCDDKCFILSENKQRLKDAPGFDKDNWPDMANAKWAKDIHDYYKATPYWN